MTDRIIREIEESRALFGIQKSTVQDTIVETPHESAVGTTGIAAPPGLQGAPVSCYTSSFASWTFNRDVIPGLEESEDDGLPRLARGTIARPQLTAASARSRANP